MTLPFLTSLTSIPSLLNKMGVVGVSCSIIFNRRALYNFFGSLQLHRLYTIFLGGLQHCLQVVNGAPSVSVNDGSEKADDLLIKMNTVSTLLQGSVNDLCHLLLGQLLKSYNPTSTQQCRVQAETWVFSSCSDEGDHSRLYVGQEGVLLGFVEPVHLVLEENGFPLEHVHLVLGLLHHLPHLGNAAGARRHLYEPGSPLVLLRDDVDQGSLPAARGAPQHNAGEVGRGEKDLKLGIQGGLLSLVF